MDGSEARAEMEVEGTHYGGAGADDGKIDFDAWEQISETKEDGRGSQAYIRVRALPTPTQVSSSERISHE